MKPRPIYVLVKHGRRTPASVHRGGIGDTEQTYFDSVAECRLQGHPYNDRTRYGVHAITLKSGIDWTNLDPATRKDWKERRQREAKDRELEAAYQLQLRLTNPIKDRFAFHYGWTHNRRLDEILIRRTKSA